MKRLIIFLFAIILSVGIYAQKVRVAAAANLRFVIEEIKNKYEAQNPSSKIDIVIGSSGMFYQQIINGAQFDLFMAADKQFPEKLKQQGAVSGRVITYAYGKLILWSSSLDLKKTGITVLASPDVKRIAVAKPDLAPYGDRAIQVLKNEGLYEKVKSKIVYGDNIAQTAQYAATGNAEAGFIALALALGPDMVGKGSYIEIDSKAYQPIEQALVMLKGWQRNPETAKFLRYLLSAECKSIFEKYGYSVP
jgi:molybdate transport system substrate-binding protein